MTTWRRNRLWSYGLRSYRTAQTFAFLSKISWLRAVGYGYSPKWADDLMLASVMTFICYFSMMPEWLYTVTEYKDLKHRKNLEYRFCHSVSNSSNETDIFAQNDSPAVGTKGFITLSANAQQKLNRNCSSLESLTSGEVSTSMKIWIS